MVIFIAAALWTRWTQIKCRNENDNQIDRYTVQARAPLADQPVRLLLNNLYLIVFVINFMQSIFLSIRAPAHIDWAQVRTTRTILKCDLR